MSYRCWREDVALGRAADWDEDKRDYADAPQRRPVARSCCVQRMVDDPPTAPHAHCHCGAPLPWHDKDDPEAGWFDSEDELGPRAREGENE